MAEKKQAAVKESKSNSPAYKTSNSVPSNAKTISIQALQARLNDGIDLALVIKQAHWNLKGIQFIAIHEMLDGFRTEQDDWVDMIAERIVQLGGTAHGTTQDAAKGTTLAPYPDDITSIPDHLKALIERYAAFSSSIRQNIDETDEAGDATTADLFTEVSRGLDKQLWFLESHLAT